MNSPWKTLALVLLLCTGTACSHIGSQAPDEMVRRAMQHNLTRDNQYQFEGRFTIAATERMPRPAADAASATDVAAASATGKGGGTQRDSATDELIRHFLGHTQVRYRGAVDIPQRKIEIIPEIHYQNRQALVSVKLPVQLDLREPAVIADPAAAAPFIDAFTRKENAVPIGDKLVRVALSDFTDTPVPTEALLKAFPKAVDDGLASLDKTAFSRMDVDEEGRRAGARYRVRLSTDFTGMAKQTRAMLDSLGTQLREDGTRNGAALPEGHKMVIGMLGLAQLFYGQIADAPKDSPAFPYGAYALNMPIDTDYYLDGKGRIVALRQSTAFSPMQVLASKGQRTHQDTWMTIRYTRPQFTLKPVPGNTVSLKRLIPGLGASGKNGPAAALRWDDLKDAGVKVKIH